MKVYKIVSILVSAVLILSMSMAIVPPASAGPASSEKNQDGSEEQLGYDPDTGQLIFVGAPDGGVIASADGGTGPMAFVNAYGKAFGLDNPAKDVTSMGAAEYDGDTVTRYQQVYQGVPVFGGNLVVNTSETGGLVAMAGKVLSDISLDVNPAITPEQAIIVARAVTLKTYGDTYDLKAENLSFSEPALWIYDEKLFTDPVVGTQLVWKVDVTAAQGTPVHEVVLVNAQVGKVAVHYNKLDTQWETAPGAKPASQTRVSSDVIALAGGNPLWSVYDNNNTSTDPDITAAGVADCTEAISCSTAVDDWQIRDARDYVLDTYNFYWEVNGRDSIDGAGMRMKSVVRYGDVAFTSWWYDNMNAFWDGSKMVYYDHMAVDDVTAHELTHGVTEHESGLIYMYQSGAINESLSDVWGELVDLSNADDKFSNSDTLYRWLMGEDITGPKFAFRNMKNPPAFKDPDKITSSYFYKGPLDNGGVHTNSGVNNKAAYLMTDGGSFNGRVISGLGIEKVAAIYYQAQTSYLFPSANYLDLYYALKGACSDLIGTHGITSLDCDQVKKATEAVQMNIKPSVITPIAVEACPVNYVYGSTLYEEDFQTGVDGWSFAALGNGAPTTSSWQATTLPTNILNGTTALWAPGFDGLNNGTYLGGEESASIASPVSLTAGQQIYLTFDHMYLFESDPTIRWDGGVLEYSVNGGPWIDAKLLFSAGVNYNGTIYNNPYATNNPLEGRPAFVANSRDGSQTMRYNLTSLAGNNVQLRWHVGYDYFTDWGWFLDNVDIHTCLSSVAPAIPALTYPAANALLIDYTPTLDWKDLTPTNLDHYVVQVSTDNVFSVLLYNNNTGLTSEFPIPADLDPDTTYYWRVAAQSALGASKGWSVVRSFRTAMPRPVLNSPLDNVTLDTDRPDLDWADVPGGVTGYTVQISKSDIFKGIAMTGTVKTATSQFTPKTDLPIDTPLFWRVKANGANPSDWSVPRKFTTVNPPTVPVLVSPANNLLTTDYTPSLDWKPSTIKPLGSSTLSDYDVQIDDNADFSSPEVNDSTPLDAYTPISDLDPNTKYYWRVRSTNTAGDFSGWSLVRYFRTAMTRPTLVSPPDNEEVFILKPTFDWGDVDGAANYTLQISKVNTFKSIYKTFTVVPSTYTPIANLAAGTYFWHVRANGLNGPSSWSDYRTLVINSPGVDSDGDGLPDSWEINGYDADGDGNLDVDLPALGANYQHKDIFVEMDYMPAFCGDEGSYVVGGLVPSASVISRIEASFDDAPVTNPDATTGINIHLDLDNQVVCDTNLGDTADFDLVYSDFYALKADNFDPNRAAVYHYMIWAVGYYNDDSSGLSFGLPSTDFIVTLGSWGTGGTDDEKVGTFIHELGHNLNLKHGGTDHVSYKPNYLSIMNYFFQTSGVYRDGTWGHYDYQRITVPALNESNLNETLGLNGGVPAAVYGTSHYCPNGTWHDDILVDLPKIDWNCDGDVLDTGLKIDVNDSGGFSSLTSQNNWPAIIYNGGGIIGSGLDPQALLSLAENRPVVVMDELTLEMQQEIDRLRNSTP